MKILDYSGLNAIEAPQLLTNHLAIKLSRYSILKIAIRLSEKQKEWCDMAEIAFTPTILVNGYKLPEPYRLDDPKYLIN
jgi:hypothetical protein